MGDSIRGVRTCEYDDDFRLAAVKWDRTRPAAAAIPPDEFYSFDGRNNLVRINGRSIEPALGRDARPRQFVRGSNTIRLEYNAAGQLGAVHHTNGARWEYLYDAMGRRTRKTCFRGDEELWRWEYLWDSNTLLAERRIEGENVLRRLYLCDGPAVRVRIDEDDRGTRVFVYCNDLIGTPELCTDSSGQIVWQRTTTAFGGGFDPGSIEQNIGFPGQYFDAESGLFYNRYRYYDPSVARYIQPDPISVTGGWNPYSYAPDPFTTADPLGLSTRHTPPNAEHVTMMNDPSLLTVQPIKQMQGADPEDRSIHQFVGGTQQVVQATGQNVPHFMGPFDENRFSGQSALVLESHGLPGRVQWLKPDGSTEWIDGKTLGKRLAARGFDGNQVVLVVCHAAEKNAAGHSVAQDLADELKQQTGHDVEVIGASGTVSNLPDGTLFTDRAVVDSDGTNLGYLETPKGANFMSFSAGRPPVETSGADGDVLRPPK
jgi:RHS repeat-associated protein